MFTYARAHDNIPCRRSSIYQMQWKSIGLLLLTPQLSVSGDGSGRLIWAPCLRLAGRGLGVVDTR